MIQMTEDNNKWDTCWEHKNTQQINQASLDNVLRNMLRSLGCSLQGQEPGLEDPDGSIPTQHILWFYESNFWAQKADSNQSGAAPVRYPHPEID